jgi:hypothetical protein
MQFKIIPKNALKPVIKLLTLNIHKLRNALTFQFSSAFLSHLTSYAHLHTANGSFSVTDNAGNVVLLHVSASSERQESGNETGAVKNIP